MLRRLSVNLHAAIFYGLPFGLFTFEQDGVVAVFGEVRRRFEVLTKGQRSLRGGQFS
jgi:hypothetical protein